MRRPALPLITLLALTACSDPPTEADRAELIGVWQPDDGSGRPIEFKADGVFDYLYSEGTVLRLDWTLERKGKVSLVSGNKVTKLCHYDIEGAKLSIDDGSGAECVAPGVTPPSSMPKAFTRAS